MTNLQAAIGLAQMEQMDGFVFAPMRLQPIYCADLNGEWYPVADYLCQRGLYLPSASSLTQPEVEHAVQTARACQRPVI